MEYAMAAVIAYRESIAVERGFCVVADGVSLTCGQRVHIRRQHCAITENSDNQQGYDDANRHKIILHQKGVGDK